MFNQSRDSLSWGLQKVAAGPPEQQFVGLDTRFDKQASKRSMPLTQPEPPEPTLGYLARVL